MCRRKTGYDPAYNDLIDETLQEVFLLAYDQYETLVHHPNVLGWLMQSCNHRLLPYAKQQRFRKKHHSFSLDAPNAPILPMAENPIEHFLEEESAKEKIDTIFRLLTDKEKVVFDAFFINQQSIAHIAQTHQVSQESIKALIYRIRKKAKKNFPSFFLFSVTFFCLLYCNS